MRPQLLGVGGADHQHYVGMLAGYFFGGLRDGLIDWRIVCKSVLQESGARVGSLAKKNRAAFFTFQERAYPVKSKKGVDRYGIDAISVKGLARIHPGGMFNIAPLCVQNHQGVRNRLSEVAD